MKTKILVAKKQALAFAVCLAAAAPLFYACDTFTETDLPNTQLYTIDVYSDKATAYAAMANVYATLRENSLISGKNLGIGYRLGLYADELGWNGSDETLTAFYNNSVVPDTPGLSAMWNTAYAQIYEVNALLEGVAASAAIPQQDKDALAGQALFVRSLLHFYLSQLWGDIPYVTVTDYQVNSVIPKTSQATLYTRLEEDLERAASLLTEEYTSPERVYPNRYAAKALLARVYLFDGKYAEAANEASAVLDNAGLYPWVSELNDVFLKESTATIWQLKPKSEGRNTDEGAAFIFTGTPSRALLRPALVQAFEPGDQRRAKWVKEVAAGGTTYYHAFKYKQKTSTDPSVEYSIVLRLAELYLVRAEARARQGELVGAKEDLNMIRSTAGLPATTAQTADELIAAVLQERRFEFFTEYGSRFIDLRRAGQLDLQLPAVKPGWQPRNRLLPLPASEILLNGNIAPQNTGY